jgi:hypothetical protein
MNRRRNKFDMQPERVDETPEEKKIRNIKRIAIAVAFLSTYYFFVKLLFL